MKPPHLILIFSLLACLLLVGGGAATITEYTYGTVIDSSHYTTWTGAMAFDGNPATTWETAVNAPGWVLVDYGEGNAYIINNYTIQARDDATNAPKTWFLAGSNDKTVFTTISDYNIDQPAWAGSEIRIFDSNIVNTNAYRYYNLSVLTTQFGSVVDISEIHYYYNVSITSSFSLNTTSGASPLSVHITDTSTNISAKIDTWNVSIDHLGINWYNTTIPTSLEYIFTQVGPHRINQTVFNFSYGLSSFSTQNITCNQTLYADFVGAPTEGYSPQLVNFVDFSTGYNPYSWNWSFGDGTFSILRNPSHTYTSPISYNVSLTVQGTDGTNTKTEINYINILIPPTANFTSNVQTAANPATIEFTDTTVSNETKTAWYWSFGDTFTSNSQNPSHTYVTNGNYTINFSVSTTYGIFWSNKTDYITVTVPAPTSEWCGIQYLYFNDTPSSIPGYQSLSNVATTTTEADKNITITSASGIVPIDSYLSISGYPGAVILSAGLRTFNTWTYISNTGGASYLVFNESIYHADGSLTPIFNTTSNDIASTSIIQLVTPFTDTKSTTFNTGDRLLINISAKTDRVAATTIHFINGGNTHGSYLETALFVCPAVSTQLPLTAFKQNITQGYSPLAVQFYDTSSYGLTRFWSFGDGTNSSEVNPLHIYTGTGQYSVTLTEANLYGTNIKAAANLINVLGPGGSQFQNQSIVLTNPYEVYYIWKRTA